MGKNGIIRLLEDSFHQILLSENLAWSLHSNVMISLLKCHLVLFVTVT